MLIKLNKHLLGQSKSLTSYHLLKRNYNTGTQELVHSSFIHNDQKLQIIQISINKLMYYRIMVYSHNEILCIIITRSRVLIRGSNTGDYGKHYVQPNPETKQHILYNFPKFSNRQNLSKVIDLQLSAVVWGQQGAEKGM